jgi:AcrR family transcriptional regulator
MAGRREEKKRQLRLRILEASEALFRGRGFDETTVDAILEAVGISRQTFFNYFPSKQAVLAEIGIAWLRRQSELPRRGTRVVESMPGALFAGMRAAIRGQLRAIEKVRCFMRLVFTRSGLFFPQGPQLDLPEDEARLDHTRALFGALGGLMKEGQKAGVIRRDLSAEQVAEIYVSVMWVTIRLWLTDYWREPGSLETRGTHALDVLEAGLRADATQRRKPS